MSTMYAGGSNTFDESSNRPLFDYQESKGVLDFSNIFNSEGYQKALTEFDPSFAMGNEDYMNASPFGQYGEYRNTGISSIEDNYTSSRDYLDQLINYGSGLDSWAKESPTNMVNLGRDDYATYQDLANFDARKTNPLSPVGEQGEYGTSSWGNPNLFADPNRVGASGGEDSNFWAFANDPAFSDVISKLPNGVVTKDAQGKVTGIQQQYYPILLKAAAEGQKNYLGQRQEGEKAKQKLRMKMAFAVIGAMAGAGIAGMGSGATTASAQLAEQSAELVAAGFTPAEVSASLAGLGDVTQIQSILTAAGIDSVEAASLAQNTIVNSGTNAGVSTAGYVPPEITSNLSTGVDSAGNSLFDTPTSLSSAPEGMSQQEWLAYQNEGLAPWQEGVDLSTQGGMLLDQNAGLGASASASLFDAAAPGTLGSGAMAAGGQIINPSTGEVTAAPVGATPAATTPPGATSAAAPSGTTPPPGLGSTIADIIGTGVGSLLGNEAAGDYWDKSKWTGTNANVGGVGNISWDGTTANITPDQGYLNSVNTLDQMASDTGIAPNLESSALKLLALSEGIDENKLLDIVRTNAHYGNQQDVASLSNVMRGRSSVGQESLFGKYQETKDREDLGLQDYALNNAMKLRTGYTSGASQLGNTALGYRQNATNAGIAGTNARSAMATNMNNLFSNSSNASYQRSMANRAAADPSLDMGMYTANAGAGLASGGANAIYNWGKTQGLWG